VSEQGRALIIDDDADIAELLTILLECRGFAVDVVDDGIHALDPASDYDVILLDMKMPVFDGERLTDYWLATRPELLRKVIVLSGYSRYTRGRQLPTFAAVTKPFDLEEISAAIDACVRQSRAQEPSA
jgi:DNA-binding response OmpR family regulator